MKHKLPLNTIPLIFLLLSFGAIYQLATLTGQLFLTDFVLPPRLFNNLLPAGPVQLFLFWLILAVAGCSLLALAKRFLPSSWSLTAGLLFLLNPYVYDRFLAGQWRVLAGYAWFPLAVLSLLFYLEQKKPKPWHFLLPVLTYSLYPLISPHWWYIYTFWAAFYLAISWKSGSLKFAFNFKKILASLVVFAAFQACWLYYTSQRTVTTLSAIDAASLPAFQTLPDEKFGLLLNVLGLYGFWQDNLLLPKDFFPAWWIVSLLLLGLSVLGLRELSRANKPLAITLLVGFLLAVVLAMGYASPITRPVVQFFFTWLPGFKGLRETAKLVGLIAFFYALLAPWGLRFLLEKLYPAKFSATVGVALLGWAGIMLSFGLFTGFNHQVKPSTYPASWVKAQQVLNQEKAGTVIFFPWKGYLRFPFSQNRLVANPAPAFFRQPVIAGTDTANGFLISTNTGPWEDTMYDIIQGFSTLAQATPKLKEAGVTHIILSKAEDWDRYAFLDYSPVEQVLVTKDLIIYRLP